MDIQLLKEFVSLARCLSFSEAANENYISQPTLSKHISFLEELLQITLFKRDKRTVELTEGGRLFLEDALRITEDYDRALERIKMYREGLAGELRIAYLENTRPGDFYACVKRFSGEHPNTKMTFHVYHDIGSIFEAVRDDQVDVAITVYTADLDKYKMGYSKLSRLPIGVCLSKEDSLAGRESLRIADIADRTIFMGDEGGLDGMAELFRSACREKGIQPKLEYHARGVNCMGLVLLGKGVSFFIHGSDVPATEEHCLVDFAPEEYSAESVIMWHTKNSNPEIRNFVNTLSHKR